MSVKDMNRPEDTLIVKDIIQTLLKTKKAIRTYPENNPVYSKMIAQVFSKFSEFLSANEELVLGIKLNEIVFEAEQVYFNPGRDDNLAMFFFKDGLRELSFGNKLTIQELEEFLRIITLDFEREAVDDDIVTMLWEKDFPDIKYVVDENFLTEEGDYETDAVKEIKQKQPSAEEFQRAFADSLITDEATAVPVVVITEDDIAKLASEIKDDKSEDKLEKLSGFLFDILFLAEHDAEYEIVFDFIKETLKCSVRQGDLRTFISTMRKLRRYSCDPEVNETYRKHFNDILRLVNTEELIKGVSELFDLETETDDAFLNEYTGLLDNSAVTPIISALGELKTIKGRRKLITILIELGKKDLQGIVKGLKDPRWYVVRNIIYILRHIGDQKAIEYLMTSTKHPDIRVRKEAVRALGELKNNLALQVLRYSLDDPDVTVRKASVEALCSIGSDTAKRIILSKVSQKDFTERDFEEKKAFYEGLSAWAEPEVSEFMLKTLAKTSLFKKPHAEEDRACAAHGLGLMGIKGAIPLLEKLKDSGNKLLSEHARSALRRLEHDRQA